MGMKFNSGKFHTQKINTQLRFNLNIQLFGDKKISKKGEKLLNKASDIKLKNIINELYRQGANIGDGGTADAIRYEIKYGEKIKNKSHIFKGIERLRNLERFMARNDISKKDRKIAEKLYKDLKDALGGKIKWKYMN